MAASSAAASPYCVSIATETDSEETGRIDTESESESSGPCEVSGPESVVSTEGHAPRKRRKCQRCPQSSDAPDRDSAMDSKPVSSGCFDFVTWVVSERLKSAELNTLCEKFPLRVVGRSHMGFSIGGFRDGNGGRVRGFADTA